MLHVLSHSFPPLRLPIWSMAAAWAFAHGGAKLASASGRARADEPQPRRDLDRLRAPGGAELRCGVAQVEKHRRYRQRQDGADLAVGLARGRPAPALHLAPRQRLRDGGVARAAERLVMRRDQIDREVGEK